MDSIEFSEELEQFIGHLNLLRKKGQTIAVEIIGKTLTKDDLYFCAATDRCLNLIDGFICMIRERNLTCAGALLRLQMDNCMRTYAAFIAQDRMTVIDCMISGKRINQQLSKDGHKLSDSYLKKELTLFDNCFDKVYDQASGYIHLSEKSFYQTIVKCDDYHIELQVGHSLPEYRNPVIVEATKAFIHFVELHYRMLEAVAESKKRFDSQI